MSIRDPRSQREPSAGARLRQRLHGRVEAAFGRWGALVARRPWPVALAVLAFSAYLISWVPQLRADNSTESFLREGDPARGVYDAFREQFGQDERMVVGIRTGTLFSLATLARIRALHAEIEAEVPYLLEITSLWNARNTRGAADELIVEDLMADWPETPDEVEALRRRVFENPLYIDTLVSEDATFATLTLKPNIYSARASGDDLAGLEEEFDDAPAGTAAAGEAEPARLSEAEQTEQLAALEAVLARHRGEDFELHLGGGGVANRVATRALMRDVTVFMSGCFVTIFLLLFALFRRASGVFLPLLVVFLSLLSTWGAMALVDIPTSVSGQVLPVLVLTTGVCSAVHVLAVFYRELDTGTPSAAAISAALGHSGLAVMLAALTTAAGLLSFAFAELAQVMSLGIMAPIGIVLGFFYSVTLLPALLALSRVRPRPDHPGARLQRRLGAWLARLGAAAVRNPWRVVLATAALVLLALPGLLQVRLAQDGLRWFPEDAPVRVAYHLMDRGLRGIMGLEVVVDTGRPNGLHDPEILRRMERAAQLAQEIDHGEVWIGKAISIVDVVKETHRALNENRADHYAIPDQRELVAQELLLFEQSGTDDLEELTDGRFQLARVSLRMPWTDAMYLPRLMQELEALFTDTLGEGVEVTVTGIGALFGRTFSVVNTTMARSYAIALLIITPLMALLIGSVRRGLLAMIPNLLPILLVIAVMGYLGIDIDNSSLLIGAVIIGLAVDDTIHFMHKFQRYLDETGDVALAVRETLTTTGSALLFTTLVLTSGFLVMGLAYMKNAAEFGLLCALATALAFLADLFLSPALMTLANGRRS